MNMNRREFLHLMTLAGAAGILPNSAFASKKAPADFLRGWTARLSRGPHPVTKRF